jgi:DNA-binding winged helix-turn-helix (wHTH) protein/Tol biopolymer transport system component
MHPEMENRGQSGGGAESTSNVRFGPFELDFRAGELRKEGRRIRLQEQPLQILRMLLESPGEVVSRDEIRKRLWPDDTVVEFDHSISAAVRRLRDALRDSADKPRYIETLARRGYRFIGGLETADHSRPAEPVAVAPENTPTDRPPKTVPSGLHFWQSWIVRATLVAAMILVVSLGVWYSRRKASSSTGPLQPLMRLDLDLGSEARPGPQSGANAILSPDGTRLVYVSHGKLFARRLDQPNATELSGTEGARNPFFSPDGQWIAFFAGRLKKASIQSGQVVTLCKDNLADGGSWGEDGSIVAALDVRLSRIPSTGGTPTPVTQLLPGEVVHRWPQILPGGKAVLFTAYRSMTGLDGATIEVLSLRDGRRKTLIRGGSWGRYLNSGHLLYIDKGTVLAVPFDLGRLEVHGTPTPVLEEVEYSVAWGSAQIDFSRVGTIVYRSSKGGAGLVTVQWLDAVGSARQMLPTPGSYLSPRLSPDGSKVALISASDIWVYELGRGSMVRLTFGGGYLNPIWSADSRYVVFRSTQGMVWTRADGTGQVQPLIQSNNRQVPWSFTADGKRLAFVEPDSAGGAAIWTVPVESSGSGLRAGKPEVFLQAQFNARCPVFSPDGNWLAYMSNESGTNQVYVQAFPDKHVKRQISADGGGYPAWSRDEVFFWAHSQLMAASYKVHGNSFVADQPRVWIEKRLAGFSTTRSYDPAPDGKHVVVLAPAETPDEPHDHVIFLLNFFDDLRRRVPSSTN